MDRATSMTVFVRVVEGGSFAAAARRLRMSPAMVSTHVQSLEDRLGVRLLNRTTRKLSLTEIGETVYERCAHIVGEIEAVEALTTTLQATPRGILRIASPLGPARYLAPPIAAYAAAYPEVSVVLTVTDRVVDVVEEGFDLALRIGPLADSSLVARRLNAGRLIVCGAPAYLAARGTPQRPEDLAHHNCLLFEKVPHSEWRFTGADGEHVVPVAGNLCVNSADVMRVSMLCGQGLGVLSDRMLADDIEAGRLVRVLERYALPPLIVHAVYPQGRYVSAKLRSFLDWITTHGAFRTSLDAPPQEGAA
jgi:DNA-binding transcriptional LysR family regulator